MGFDALAFVTVQQEVAEKAVERYRLERKIREVKAETARKRALLAARGRTVEMRPRFGHSRSISFDEAMSRIEKTNPLTAARLRAARKGN